MTTKPPIKVACFSDTHGNWSQVLPYLDRLKEEDVNLIIHSGDICGHYIDRYGRPGSHDDRAGQTRWFLDNWAEWCAENPQIQMVMIPGNHDFAFAEPPKWAGNFWDWKFQDEEMSSVGYIPGIFADNCPSNLHILNQTSVELFGRVIWGGPHSPNFWNWAFNFPKDPMEYEKVSSDYWEQIPSNVDILISHGPPQGILDKAPDGRGCGCYHLKKQLGCGVAGTERIAPELMVFGHIHSGHGNLTAGKTTFVNASMCNEKNQIVNPPTIITLT